MSDRIDVLGTARNLFSLLWGMLGYVLRFLWLFVLPKALLVAKLMAEREPIRPHLLAARRLAVRMSPE